MEDSRGVTLFASGPASPFKIIPAHVPVDTGTVVSNTGPKFVLGNTVLNSKLGFSSPTNFQHAFSASVFDAAYTAYPYIKSFVPAFVLAPSRVSLTASSLYISDVIVKGTLGFGKQVAADEEVTTTRLMVGYLTAARRALRAPLTVSGITILGSVEKVRLAATWATALTPGGPWIINPMI